MKHNAWSYRNGTCVCEVCTEDHRARVAQETALRAGRRVLVRGRLVAPLPAEDHGKPGTYNNHLCRCVPCTVAKAAYNRDRRVRSAAPVHATEGAAQ